MDPFFEQVMPSRKQVAAGFLLILAQFLLAFLGIVGVVYVIIVLL